MAALDVALDESKMPPNLRKLLAIAGEEGWSVGPVTVVARLEKKGAKPFFSRWDLKDGRWSFNMCRVINPAGGLMPLKISDAFIYLRDQTVIYPEDPDDSSREAREEPEAFQ